MREYSSKRKEEIIKKILEYGSSSYRKVALEEGIPVTTVYTWLKVYKSNGGLVSKNKKDGNIWSAEERFAAIVETAKLSEMELSEYCRSKGLYSEQIAEWKAAFISYGSPLQQDKAQSKADKKRINSLEKELRRKEKALAEAAALLVLRKKLQAFYGEGKEED